MNENTDGDYFFYQWGWRWWQVQYFPEWFECVGGTMKDKRNFNKYKLAKVLAEYNKL